MAMCNGCGAESNNFPLDCSVPTGWAWVGKKLYCKDCKKSTGPKKENYGIPPHL